MELDRRAVKIVIEGYWSSKGWRRPPEITAANFEYARQRGLLFDAISLTHDEAVDRAISARDAVRQEDVSEAFVSSLQSRRLDIRSALGSYAVALHLARHAYKHPPYSPRCEFCGEAPPRDFDRNVLSFERLKWGGVRHLQPSYIGFDLGLFHGAAWSSAAQKDRDTLIQILDTARSMPAKSRLGDLVKALALVFPSNADERRTTIAILGYCGILIDPNLPHFLDEFVPSSQQAHTGFAKDDWPYPVQWWTGEKGVNERAVDFWFPFATKG